MIHKWWWHPHHKRWQRMVRDWAGRHYVFDKDWNLIWWEGEWKKKQNSTGG